MKSEKLLIETPEKIIFSYNIAEIGTRIAAYLIDLIIQGVILFVLFVLMGFSLVSFDAFGEDQILYYVAIIYIVLFLFQWFYFVFFETVLNGRTPGKQACHIRVIRYNGERLDFSSLVIRNLLRAADSIPFPFFNLLGGLVAILSKNNKRLGDFAAGTIVVSDSLFHVEEPHFKTKFKKDSQSVFITPTGKSRLSEKDLYILRKLLNERNSMDKPSQERTAKIIVNKLMKKFDLTHVENKSNFEIIEEIYKAHTYEN